MPGKKFKPQYRRLLFIDRKLREGRFPSCATLAEEWEVSAKTIQRDLDYLRDSMEAPIDYDKVRHGLYYLLAFDTRWENVAQYAVSRIRGADLQPETFTPPPRFDAATVLRERFGKFVHTEGGKPTWATIRLAPELAGPMTERTWHPRQKLTRLKNGGIELRFPVPDVRDVVPWVLSLGHGVTALAPAELRRAVQTEARALMKTRSAEGRHR